MLIVGGGFVGTALANALAQLRLRTILVEAFDPSRREPPSFDARSTALARGSRTILESLGVWSKLDGHAEAIREIHISERGRFGAARIRAAEERVEALGYTVENFALGAALWQPLSSAESFRCLAPAMMTDFTIGAAGIRGVVVAAEHEYRITAKLLAAADGMHSRIRARLGIESFTDEYAQIGVVFNGETEIAPAGRAFERFTPDGPLAVLPLTRERSAFVWTLPAERAAEVAAYPDSELRRVLQQVFGMRLGRLERVGERATHPLKRVRSGKLTAERAVLIGNAALSLHPVAGQGFNLALRDVAVLADLIKDAIECGGAQADIGAASLLRAHAETRARDQRAVAAFTHGLIRLFGLRCPGLGTARGIGLTLFDVIPGAKHLLARHTMGRIGWLPRLARGLRLDS